LLQRQTLLENQRLRFDTSDQGFHYDTPGMSEPNKREIKDVQEEITELARRALIQASDLQAVEEKLKGITERTSKHVADEERTD
jgi:hypothetical protein